MRSERWNEIKDKLHEALQLEPMRRAVYLAEAGATDPDLQRELESLIAFHEPTGTDFLNTLWAQATSVVPPQEGHEDFLGQRVGSYQIAGLIGVGGMGEVYRAFRADDEYKKQVAIKLVRAGQSSALVVNRFKNERQILASLDHPNIARLLDGGTTQNGVPYFVMELIEGHPIDQYCDTNKLSIAERLKLFVQVCSAVQYAHQHLVIHRDIKPSSILVTSEGVPKLLDFGIAKILEEGADVAQLDPTLTLFRVLTPGYASPEQVQGTTITTSSDIYSLGVVLYVLLTGRSPYQMSKPTAEDITRAVCEVEPEKPSSVVRRAISDGKDTGQNTPAYFATLREGSIEKLSNRLRGDLDDISLMALRKERQRRYASVDHFADDIERHLASLPVLARKDTWGYRTSTFVRRHRLGVAATCAVGLTLLIALIVTIGANRDTRRQADLARTERARAERRFNDVRQLSNWMIFDLPGAIHPLPGSVTAEKILYDHGLKYLDSIAAEGEGDPSLQRELAAGYKALGDAQGFPYGGNLGDLSAALASYRKSLRIREQLVKSDRSYIADQIDLAKVYRTIGALLNRIGDARGAQENAHKALEIIRPLAESPQENTNVLHEYGVILLTLASVDGGGPSNGLADPAVELKYNLDSVRVFRTLAAKQPEVPLWQRQVAYMDGVISTDYLLLAKRDEAIHYAQEALTILDHLDLDPDVSARAPLVSQKADAHSKVGDALLFMGRWKEAVSEYRDELVLLKTFYDEKDRRAQDSLADGYINLGHSVSLEGEFRTGLNSIQRGITLLQLTIRKDAPVDSEALARIGSALIFKGETLEGLGDEAGALQSYGQAADAFDSPAFANGHQVRLMKATALVKVAGALAHLGYYDRAGNTCRKALATADVRPDSLSTSVQAKYTLIAIYTGMGDIAAKSAKPLDAGTTAGRSACEWHQKAADLWLQLPVRTSISPVGLFKVPEFDTVSNKLANCK
jgi:serine/threonine protein kinase